MSRLLRGFLLVFLFVPAACGQDQAAQWLETARFEERQHNLVHAKQLYEDIVRQYPDSTAAQSARVRLEELAKARPPER